jgi:hypothetical protein
MSAVKITKLKTKNSPGTEGDRDARFSLIVSDEGVLQSSSEESSPRLSKAGTQAARVVASLVACGPLDEATTSNR